MNEALLNMKNYCHQFPNIMFKNNPSSDWNEILSESIVTADKLHKILPITIQKIENIIKIFPMRINPYYLSLINKKHDPIWKQAIPSMQEIEDSCDMSDPLSEETQSPVPNLIHRYPDRVILMVSDQCALYCRHCMRKRNIGYRLPVAEKKIAAGIKYISDNQSIREVILSGGDPFLLDDKKITLILTAIRRIPHIEIIRIHTRTPCSLPQRINKQLADCLKKFHPLFINIQFNHPNEITPEASIACELLADAGIPLGCQTVLLKDVNDKPEVMGLLMKKLLTIRVRPYYIHHADPVKGTCHFRTSVNKGLDILKSLRGHLSGTCVPQYMIDLPGGGGKIPLLPEYVKKIENGNLAVTNYKGEKYFYPLE